MKPGHVPTARIGPVLERLIAERWPDGGGDGVLAEMVGCDRSAIRFITDQKYPGVSFDFADRLLCALGPGIRVWRSELEDVYYGVEFRETCASPICDKQFHEKVVRASTKQYCSKKCSVQAWKIEHGSLTGNRIKNRCFKGHAFTPENTIVRPDGRRLCRTCERDRRREKMQDPAYRARQRRYERECRARKAAA